MASLTLSRPFKPRELTHTRTFSRPRLRLVDATTSAGGFRSPGRRALMARVHAEIGNPVPARDLAWEVACDRMIDEVWAELNGACDGQPGR